jgi:hypothetical protein
MPSTLREEIDAIAADRLAAEGVAPGRFWGGCGRTLSRAEAEVFGIAYLDFLRMITVLEAWYDFADLTMDGPIFHSEEAIARERALRPELSDSQDPEQFREFAREVGDLTERQAEAIYWKDWFWIVREGHVTYADEPEPRKARSG